MQITQFLSTKDTIRQLSQKELSLGQQVLKTNMGLKPGESLLIVTDPNMLQKEAAIWFEAGKTITEDTQLICFEGMTENAQEPPKDVTEKMQQADVALLQTTYSLSHTKARKSASKAGTRIASLPTVTHEIIMRSLSIDYTPIAKTSKRIEKLLTKAKKAHISSKNGTDITMDLSGRKALADGGLITKMGEFGNLPAGEAMLAPQEETAQGTYVVDGSFSGLTVKNPITITVKDGIATKIEGGTAAKKLIKQLNEVGSNAYNIAELGVGTNPSTNPTGPIIEAEKAYGTVHIALGNNMSYGGSIDVPFHSDGVILSPTLTLDNKTILKDGEFDLDN